MAALVFGAAVLAVDKIREKRELKRQKKADNARRYEELERETALRAQSFQEVKSPLGKNNPFAPRKDVAAQRTSLDSSRSREEQEVPRKEDMSKKKKPR